MANFVYILYSSSQDRFYKGQTSDIKDRLLQRKVPFSLRRKVRIEATEFLSCLKLSKMLISKEEVIKAVGLEKPGMRWIADPLMAFFKINKVNEVYHKIKDFEQDEFVDQLLQELAIEPDIPENWHQKLPEKGPVIFASNHPHGALDGIVLFKVIRQFRPDFKFMGNFLLSRIRQMEGMVIPVNPLDKHKKVYSSLTGLRTALNFLKEGGALGIFPAAGISQFQLKSLKVEDPDWNISATKFIRKANCPVVPIFIHGVNSWRFQLASFISPDLKLVQQVPETFRKTGQKIKISFGAPLHFSENEESFNPREWRKILKSAVYNLKEVKTAR